MLFLILNVFYEIIVTFLSLEIVLHMPHILYYHHDVRLFINQLLGVVD
jgi:hypothetical protein